MSWSGDPPTGLAAAVRAFGGVRAAATAADLNPSNLSRYLRTGFGLGDEKVAQLEKALGRPGGQTDQSRVLVLRVKRPDPDLAQALAWYLPQGGELARAAWSALTLARLKKFLRINLLPEIYGVRSGQVRLLVLLPAGPMMPRTLVHAFPRLRWWKDDPDRAVLDIADPVPWAKGEVDVPTFDAAWPGQAYDPTLEDMVEAVRRLGISYAEAIRRIHRAR